VTVDFVKFGLDFSIRILLDKKLPIGLTIGLTLKTTGQSLMQLYTVTYLVIENWTYSALTFGL